jgi:hypothetical protein
LPNAVPAVTYSKSHCTGTHTHSFSFCCAWAGNPQWLHLGLTQGKNERKGRERGEVEEENERREGRRGGIGGEGREVGRRG